MKKLRTLVNHKVRFSKPKSLKTSWRDSSVFQYPIAKGALTKVLYSPNDVFYSAELITCFIKSLISAVFGALF